MSLLLLERQMRSGISGGASSGGGGGGTQPGGGGGSGSIAAKPADAAAEVLVVNSHTNYSSSTDPYMWQKTASGYADAKATILGQLQKLGVRYVREVWANNNTTQRAALQHLYTQGGIRTWFTCAATAATVSIASMVTDVQANYKKVLWAVGGQNEPDNVAAGVDWATPANAMQKQLFQAFSPLGYPVYSPPLAATIPAQGGTAAYATLGNQDPYADGLDLHVYPGGYEPATQLDNHLAKAHASCMPASAPTVVSETGYDTNLLWYGGNPPAPEDIATIYAPIHLAEHLWRGIAKVAFYELYDRRVTATAKAADSVGAKAIRERSFGLIAWDNQAEPSFRAKGEAVALGRVQYLLSDPGAAFSPLPLGATITNVPSDVKQLVYGKRDGSYLVFLWRLKRLWTPPHYTSPTFYDGVRLAAPAGETVTLTLNQPGTVQTYRPSLGATSDQFGAAPVPTSSQSGTTFTAPVGTDLVILKILPQ